MFDGWAFDDGAFDDGAFDDGAFDDGAFDDGALDDGALDSGGAEVSYEWIKVCWFCSEIKSVLAAPLESGYQTQDGWVFRSYWITRHELAGQRG